MLSGKYTPSCHVELEMQLVKRAHRQIHVTRLFALNFNNEWPFTQRCHQLLKLIGHIYNVYCKPIFVTTVILYGVSENDCHT